MNSLCSLRGRTAAVATAARCCSTNSGSPFAVARAAAGTDAEQCAWQAAKVGRRGIAAAAVQAPLLQQGLHGPHFPPSLKRHPSAAAADTAAKTAGVAIAALPRFAPSAPPTHAAQPVDTLVQALDIDAEGLLRKLQEHPTEKPMSAAAAEKLMLTFESSLQQLSSPVSDVPLPAVNAGKQGGDPRLIIVGDTHGQLRDVLHIFATQGFPSRDVVYIFNGDIADKGKFAVEIWLLLAAFKLRHPESVHVLRGNHENEQMNRRCFRQGGGFEKECLSKYGPRLREVFRRVFKLLPLFAVAANEVFVVHGGLFRTPGVTLKRLRRLPEASWRRSFPNPPPKGVSFEGWWTEDEEILFDAQWADPHDGDGLRPSSRGGVAVTFGKDITKRFLDEADLSLCIRSHRVPDDQRGFEYRQDGRLLTVFSASDYGGVLGNPGAVAVLRAATAIRAVTAPTRALNVELVEHDTSSEEDIE